MYLFRYRLPWRLQLPTPSTPPSANAPTQASATTVEIEPVPAEGRAGPVVRRRREYQVGFDARRWQHVHTIAVVQRYRVIVVVIGCQTYACRPLPLVDGGAFAALALAVASISSIGSGSSGASGAAPGSSPNTGSPLMASRASSSSIQ